jgi:hypothetical protein
MAPIPARRLTADMGGDERLWRDSSLEEDLPTRGLRCCACFAAAPALPPPLLGAAAVAAPRLVLLRCCL